MIIIVAYTMVAVGELVSINEVIDTGGTMKIALLCCSKSPCICVMHIESWSLLLLLLMIFGSSAY